MIPRLLVTALAALVAASARADGGYLETRHDLAPLLSVTWEGAQPLGSLRSDIDRRSLTGGQVEARFGVARHLSLGLATSWSWFSRALDQSTGRIGDATVTAPAYRRNQFFTLRATGHWYLTGGPVQPYVGLAAGGARSDTYRALASTAATSRAFGFAIDPQIGVLVAFRRGFALHLMARYQYTTVRIGDVRDPGWVSFGVGLAGY